MTTRLVERKAARIVLLDPNGLVLLQEIRADDSAGSVWITPGGGLALGETYEAAAIRELREEVGYAPVELGPCVWTRDHEFDFHGTYYRQHERFFLARADPFLPDNSGMDELELELVVGHRWWGVDEVESAKGTAFAPRLLARHLRPLVQGILPKAPIDVGA